MNIIATLEKEEIARFGRTIPAFAPGDTVIVNVNVVEGERKRVQAYEGVVIAKRNRGLNSSFVVRKISSGEGVERTFQTYSPLIAGIEVKRKGDVRRAKLYYLRIVPASPRGSAKSSRTSTGKRKARRSRHGALPSAGSRERQRRGSPSRLPVALSAGMRSRRMPAKCPRTAFRRHAPCETSGPSLAVVTCLSDAFPRRFLWHTGAAAEVRPRIR